MDMVMDESIVNVVLKNAKETMDYHLANPITAPAAYGLAVHVVMYMLSVDTQTACLLFPPPPKH